MVLFSRDLWNDAAAAAAVTRRTYTKNEIFQVQYRKKRLRNTSDAKKVLFDEDFLTLLKNSKLVYINDFCTW